MWLNYPKPEMLADWEINNMHWDIIVPFMWVAGYSATMWAFGYYEGKKVAARKYNEVADLYRAKQAQAKQLYDWETHGL
jgi:hypothetical protein